MRSVFFGGTFDPFHNGHLMLARTVRDRGLAEKILFVPAPEPPHKTERHLSSYENRFVMTELGIRGEAQMEISDIENHRKGRSFSIDTLRLLKTERRHGEILLLIGADSLLQLHTWHLAKELVREFRLIVYPRPGAEITKEQLRLNWNEAETEKLTECVMKDVPLFSSSSTAIRQMFREGRQTEAEEFLPEKVYDYLLQHKLY